MAFLVKDRVLETASAPGTGIVTLLGAVTGYQSFSTAFVTSGTTTYYCIADQSGNNWEVGLGTFTTTSGNQLARTTVYSSSNSGALVNFNSGIQNVFVTYPSEKAVYLDTLNTATVPQLATNSTTSTTPVLSFNASNSNYAAGATVSGSYLQTLLQNKSGTAGASTNYVLSNDLGTDSSYYGEFGMNSSVYSSGTPSDFYSINNGVYFSGHDGDITVGSGNGYKLYFAWGTTGQSAHVINASGAIGLSTNLGSTPATSGTSGFGTTGQVLTSGGSSAAPTWTTLSSVTVTTISGGTTGLTPATATGGAVTLGGTLNVANGGTGITSFGTGVATALGQNVTGTGGIALLNAPTFTGNPIFNSTGAITLPVGTTAQEPASPTSGMLRFNSSTSQFEGYNGSAWASVGGAAISNDTSTSSFEYPLFANATSGTALTVYTSNAKYLYKPSTGELQASEINATNGLHLNSATVSASYTIATGNNAMSVGPISVASGQSVTVSSGCRWVVL